MYGHIQQIRRKILECGSIRSLEYLGNAFDQVQCPASSALGCPHGGSRFFYRWDAGEGRRGIPLKSAQNVRSLRIALVF